MEQDITIYLTKAEESIRTAESEFANGRYNSCANRCYYACFQAAIAALLSEGIRPRGQWSHEFVQGQFGFDHGVGHPLLLLYDAKAPLGKNSNYFNGLGHNFSNPSIRLFYIIIK